MDSHCEILGSAEVPTATRDSSSFPTKYLPNGSQLRLARRERDTARPGQKYSGVHRGAQRVEKRRIRDEEEEEVNPRTGEASSCGKRGERNSTEDEKNLVRGASRCRTKQPEDRGIMRATREKR